MQDLVDNPVFETLALDVCDMESIRAAGKEVIKITGGQLHVLVNNAYVSLFPKPVPVQIIDAFQWRSRCVAFYR
jgi:NAD(P)-dependent dehydrogenase (short-subunit alcohol dehydrogenase family)